MINFILLVVAWAMKVVLTPLLVAYGIVRSITKWELLLWFKKIAISIDRLGNTLGGYLFNDLLGDGFGNGKETISSRLGKCQKENCLTRFGRLIILILDSLDKNHCSKSIDNNI
jgi:hypothetical protein